MSYKDREWMIEQYKVNESSQREIAEMCNVSQSTISTWLDKHNISKRSRSEANSMFSSGQPEGWEMSDEGKESLREKRLGKNNPNWKNGEWTCENCGQYGGELHTHHANPVSDGGSKWDNTFIVLCYDCHQGDYEFWHCSTVKEQLEEIAY